MGQRVTFAVPGRPSAWQRTNDFIHPTTGRLVKVTDKDQRVAQARIANVALEHWRHGPVAGPVVLRVVGIFRIPPSWPRALQQAAFEARVMHVQDPDLDQLYKQVKDALRGICYCDDNQVCGYPNGAKRYGSPERTEITIEVLDQRPDEITPGQRRLEARLATGWVPPMSALERRVSSQTKSGRRRP